MKIFTGFAICVCAWGQTGVGRPQVGKMLDENGAVRTVYGIAASVTVGDAEITGVLSSACSNTFCLAKTETSIVSASGSVAAPSGPALFAFNGGRAFVWFPQSRQLAEWQDGALTYCPLPDGRGSLAGSRQSDAGTVPPPNPDCQGGDVDGDVLSIGMNAGAVQFAVRRRSGVWIVNLDGGLAGSLPRSTGPVMLIPGGAVYATESALVIRDVQFPLAGVTAFSQMAGSFLEVRAGGIDYALRIDQGRETLFQLPGARP
jgi:hypothetical protein